MSLWHFAFTHYYALYFDTAPGCSDRAIFQHSLGRMPRSTHSSVKQRVVVCQDQSRRRTLKRRMLWIEYSWKAQLGIKFNLCTYFEGDRVEGGLLQTGRIAWNVALDMSLLPSNDMCTSFSLFGTKLWKNQNVKLIS